MDTSDATQAVSLFSYIPKDLLVIIFDFAGPDNWAAISIVCRQWADIIESFKEVRVLHTGRGVNIVFHLCRGILHSPLIDGVREPAVVIACTRKRETRGRPAYYRVFDLVGYFRYGVLHRSGNQPALSREGGDYHYEVVMEWFVDGDLPRPDPQIDIATDPLTLWAAIAWTKGMCALADTTLPKNGDYVDVEYDDVYDIWLHEMHMISIMINKYLDAPTISIDDALALIDTEYRANITKMF